MNSFKCGGLSWMEAGWIERAPEPIKYYFGYLVPNADNCNYNELRSWGSPAYNSFHEYRISYCTSCSGKKWRFRLDGDLKKTVNVGWNNAQRVNAGGEVSESEVGMQGGINNLQYKRGTTWFSFDGADWERCDPGYNLIWNGGAPDDIFDWGYAPPGGCPGD